MSIKFSRTKGRRFDVYEARGNKGDIQQYDIRTKKRLWTHIFVQGSVHNDRTDGEISMKAGTWTDDYPKHLLGIRTFTCEEDNTLFYCIHQKDTDADYRFEKGVLGVSEAYDMAGKTDLFLATGQVEIDGKSYNAPMLLERPVTITALSSTTFLTMA